MKQKVFVGLCSLLILLIITGYNFAAAGSERANARSNGGNSGNTPSVSVPTNTTQNNNVGADTNTTPQQNSAEANVGNTNSTLSQDIINIPLPLAIQELNTPSSRILVRYFDGATEELKSSLSKQVGMTKIKDMKNKGWTLYEVSGSKVPGEVLKKIREKRGTLIAEAEMDILVSSSVSVNDPYFANQWHHKTLGSEEAWAVQPSSDIIVAVADTGVDRNHPDLQNNTLLPGFNTVKNNSDDTDTVGHGTSVIGSIAAVGGNSTGVVGTAFQSKILPIKITGDGLSSAYLSDIGEAIIHATSAGAKIINISFGPLCSSAYFNDAALQMKKNGGLVVVSAGNDGQESSCSETSNVIYVSATDKNNSKTSWSSYGKFVDIAAPGEGIVTTTTGGGYGSVSGTSFSSPIVAGSLALLWSKNPTLNNDTIESIMKKTAIDLGSVGFDPLYGSGLLNSKNALLYDANNDNTPTPPPTEPTPDKDTEAPVFTFISHTEGSIINPRGVLVLSAQTTDNIGTAEMNIIFDGMVIAQCLNTYSCKSFPFNTRKITTGDHTVIFIAKDKAGNTANKTIVMKKNI